MSRFGVEFNATLKQNHRRVVSQPSRSPVRRGKASLDTMADDGSDSDDPLLLTENSSPPRGSARGTKYNPRSSDDDDDHKDRRRATSSKATLQESEEQQRKKRPRGPANPFSTGLTRTGAKSARDKATAPSAASASKGVDMDKTPKAVKKRGQSASSSQVSAHQGFPMQHLQKSSSSKPVQPESPRPASRPPKPTAEVKPFPLESLAKEKAGQRRDDPAPFPLAANVKVKKAATIATLETLRPSRPQKSASTAAATRPLVPSVLGKKDRGVPSSATVEPKPKGQQSLRGFISQSGSTPRNSSDYTSTDTPSPTRPELLRKTPQPFPLDPALRPFPMVARKVSKPSPKRPNEDAVNSDRSSKRRKHSSDDEISSPEASIRVDPSLLCPFCDDVLPEKLSSVFDEMLAAALKESWNAPRRANPRGKRAPLLTYISVCERHRFEAKILPQAIAAGWPTKIDFNALPGRVQRKHIKDVLDNVLKDPAKSSFFLEAAENIVRVGARVAESAMGQFAVFENIQPGYYGERGSIMLHQTLFSLYPPQVLAEVQFAPLSTQTFLHAVLVPEAALALIMEDTKSSRHEALKVMRASSRYGTLMFPDDDDDEGGAGEAMMRERARQRRKELDQEEADDKRLALEAKERAHLQRMEVESDSSQTSFRRPTTRRGTARSENSVAASESTTHRRKNKRSTDASADDDALSVDSCSKNLKHASKKPKKQAKGNASQEDNNGNISTSTTASSRPVRATKKKPDYLEVDSDSDDAPPTAKKSRSKKVDRQPAIDLTSDPGLSGSSLRRTRASKSLASDAIEVTSNDESSSFPSSRASSKQPSIRRGPISSSSTSSKASASSVKTRTLSGNLDELDNSDDEICQDVWDALQHTSQCSQGSNKIPSSQPDRNGPLRDMDNFQNELSRSRKPRGPRSTRANFDNVNNTPKSQHTRKNENARATMTTDEETPRASAGIYKASHVSPERRSKSVSSKSQSYQRSREDDFLFSSPSQRVRASSQHSVGLDEMEECLEQMENDSGID